ncbi:MAG: gliding motility-associated C-terminal domain-containing protein [Flavobacteriales bacterium]|jgi:gliding motility-associated-like protein|nr:gliding motility-associated C-terminal domain-containing protein [Flavobacteriales bacterium]
MKTLKSLLVIIILFFSFTAKSQCGYDTLSVQITHINCYDDNTGAIGLLVPNVNASFTWVGPADPVSGTPFSSTSIPISSLYAGDYILTISEYSIPGDLTSPLICQNSDTFTVNQTNDIEAEVLLEGLCSFEDTVDLTIVTTGGTPFSNGEYTYLLINSIGSVVGTTSLILNLPPDLYSLSITDKNGCNPTYPQIFQIDPVLSMNPFMSSVGVICKDDNTGEARVFVQEGTPPFQFQWSIDSAITIEHDSFAVIEGLIPGEYSVKITDDMGCVTRDTIVVKSNPGICLTIYKVFSPNDDDTHEFWEIENIQLYPEALVLVYDRFGRQVFRRRNYINTENVAFGGKDENKQPLPSGTYYYIVDLENEDEVFKGTVTIVR